MPQDITFFSRGETPTFVNYVIAHNIGDPPATGQFHHEVAVFLHLMPVGVFDGRNYQFEGEWYLYNHF